MLFRGSDLAYIVQMNTSPMTDLEQFRQHKSVSAQDIYDLMKESMDCLNRQMIANANVILRINEMLRSVEGAMEMLPKSPPTQPDVTVLAKAISRNAISR
jgi:hypothetical protein